MHFLFDFIEKEFCEIVYIKILAKNIIYF